MWIRCQLPLILFGICAATQNKLVGRGLHGILTATKLQNLAANFGTTYLGGQHIQQQHADIGDAKRVRGPQLPLPAADPQCQEEIFPKEGKLSIISRKLLRN